MLKYTIFPDIYEKRSKIYLCSYYGKKCLMLFIKTRHHQPHICLNCLQELHIKDNYKILKLQKYGKKRTAWWSREEETEEINF